MPDDTPYALPFASRRRWVAPTILLLHLTACALIGWLLTLERHTGELPRWASFLLFGGIPLGCLVVGLFQRRARWTVVCAFAAPLAWWAGYAVGWSGDPEGPIVLAMALLVILLPLVLLSVVAAAVALAIVGPVDPRADLPDYPRCPGCGYNLTGNKTGHCPECGRAVSTIQPWDEPAAKGS